MAKKTNKTSHVLNLITNGASSEREGEASDNGQPEPAGLEIASQGAVVGVSSDDTVAVLKDTAAALKDTAAVLKDSSASLKEKEAALKDNSAALRQKEAELMGGSATLGQKEAELMDNSASFREKETVQREESATVPEKEGVQTEECVPFSESEFAQKQNSAVMNEQTPAPEADPGVFAREAAPKPTPTGDRKVIVVNETSENDKISNEILSRLTDQLEQEEMQVTDTYRMVNVMEQLLKRQNLNRYMEQYEVCTCSRCRSDVLALILTRLPSKYVVVGGSSVAPIIGFYEGRYRIRILTEIVKSCMDVKNNPRHGKVGEF